jgi:UDP-N-acetyl-D-glucosamine 4,6-dehydratase
MSSIRAWLRPTVLTRALFFIAADLLLSLMTLYLAYLLRFNFAIEPRFLQTFWYVYGTIVFLKITWLYLLKIYFAVWRFFGLHEAKRLVWAHLLTYGGFGVIYALFPEVYIPFPRSVIVIDGVLSLVLIGGLRLLKRLLLENRQEAEVPALLIGSPTKAITLIQSAQKGEIAFWPRAIVALDPDAGGQHAYIGGLRIYPPEKLDEVIAREKCEAAILLTSIPQEQLRTLSERLHHLGIKQIKQRKLLGGEHERLEDLSIEDLLARHPKDLDTTTIAAFVRNKRVMITGAGGSIGSELVRQCHAFGAEELILIDNGEYNLYRIGEEFPKAALHLISITDRAALDHLIDRTRPDLILHAAAYKHVPLCEINPHAAVVNNIQGSIHLIDAAIAHRVPRVVIISTDKAVRPTNVMGATKRIVELYAQNIESTDTEIVAVRFGNVLGSSGSVIPKFKRQIEQGGPVTVTDPEMTRYFMMIPEACQLVLQAAAIAKGGELFILDMGEPVRIVDLARQMIRLYGKEEEIKIVFTGIRPGEKLYEELLISPEDVATEYPSITVASPTHYPIETLRAQIEELMHTDDIVGMLGRIVPEYRPSK